MLCHIQALTQGIGSLKHTLAKPQKHSNGKIETLV